jgi:hypothetical protein
MTPRPEMEWIDITAPPEVIRADTAADYESKWATLTFQVK